MISPDPLMRFPAQRAYALAAVAGRLSVLFGDGAQGERPPAGGFGRVNRPRPVRKCPARERGARRVAVPEVRHRAGDPHRAARQILWMFQLSQIPGDGAGRVSWGFPHANDDLWPLTEPAHD